ncbi:protein-glutamate O-methyltransferase [Rhodobacteraceae bacterium N5(2021)]|uniref:Chemotaxis protein methyltransferase n=2 Tax=Gymnodinialimonas phycosphaerae TaxID=2841589 RepID=A0A975TYN1_9RHOB|nr:protein-glutamate O-methyltransferase [Gymnodinialimonas phycosphaerae]
MPQTAVRTSSPSRQTIGDAAFETIARCLQEETGIVLSEAKKGLAVSRLSRRLRVLGLSDFDAYCDILSGPSAVPEIQEMILLLTTNVTRFFREPHHFESLRSRILPGLIAKAKVGGRVRIWSAGCSSGEEAYSIAMTMLEVFPEAASSNIRILATDIDRNVIRIGQKARYKLSEEDFSEHAILSKYTTKVEGADHQFDVVASAKSMVQFGQLNLMDPWPMQGKFDIVFCRNVVIYFSTETQQRLWPRFANIIVDGGHLMIGHSERVTGPATEILRSTGVTHYELKSRGAIQ